jgi:hypothetical protein
MLNKLSVLCREIGMPEAASEEVLRIAPSLDLYQLGPGMGKLFIEDQWMTGLDEIRQILGDDLRGMKMLTVELICALKTRERYRELGISNEIFLATMDCFPRFVKEHMASFGCYGFDREWWTVHQLSCLLFRVGLLEFELREKDVALHIPTGAHLEPEAVDASLEAIKETIAAHFPRWKDFPRVCHSWLLSPTMQELLPEDSKILKFQRRFAVTLTGEDNNDFLQWCFKRKDIPFDALPEETSLQRKLKAKLLRGEPFLDARGVLME